MASNSTTYQSILNDLNRDVARQQPEDVVQFCADWFQDRLRHEVRAVAMGLLVVLVANVLALRRKPKVYTSFSKQDSSKCRSIHTTQ